MCRVVVFFLLFFFFSSRRRHTRWNCDWSSDVCSSDLNGLPVTASTFAPPLWVMPSTARRDTRTRHPDRIPEEMGPRRTLLVSLALALGAAGAARAECPAAAPIQLPAACAGESTAGSVGFC